MISSLFDDKFFYFFVCYTLKVCCGWSHTVLRGIRPDGSMASSAWGRKDLGQYPTDETTGTSDRITSPQPLATLPNKSAVREVWTGSEFTVVADEVSCNLFS